MRIVIAGLIGALIATGSSVVLVVRGLRERGGCEVVRRCA